MADPRAPQRRASSAVRLTPLATKGPEFQFNDSIQQSTDFTDMTPREEYSQPIRSSNNNMTSASNAAAAVAPLLYVQLTQSISEVRSELRMTASRDEQARAQLERQISALVEPVVELRQAVQHQQQRLREVELASRSVAGNTNNGIDAQQVARAVWSVQNRVEADQRSLGEDVQTAQRQVKSLMRQQQELEQAVQAAATRAMQQNESAYERFEARFKDKLIASDAKAARLEAQLEEVTKTLTSLTAFPAGGSSALAVRSPASRRTPAQVSSPSSGESAETTALATLDAQLVEGSSSSGNLDNRMQQQLRAWLQQVLFEREHSKAGAQTQLEARIGALEAQLHSNNQQLAQALKDQQASAEQTAALRQQLLAARRQTELNGEEMQRAFAALKTNFTSNVKLLRQSILQQEKEFQRAAQNEQREAHRTTMTGVEESEKRTRAGLTALEQVLRAETTQRLHAHETLQRWKDEVNAQLRDSKHDSVRVMSDKVHEVETALVALQSSLSQTLDSQVDRQTKVSHALVAEVAELRAYTHAAKDALQKKYKTHKADVSAALQQAESRLAAQVTSKGEQLDKQLLEGVQSLDQRLEATIAELRDERVQLAETQKAHALEVDNKQTAATQQLRAYLAENDRNLHQQLEAHTQALRTEASEAEQRHIASIHEVELRVTGNCDRAVAQLKSSTAADAVAAETRAKEREAELQREMDTRTTTQDQALRALQSTCDERHSATQSGLQQVATSMQELDLRLQNRIESTQSSLSSALEAAKQQLNASILEVGAQNDSQVALVRQAVLACVERVDALEAKVPTIDTSIAELGERATKLGEANKESEEKALQAVAALRSAVDADKLAESARLDRLAASMEEQKAAHISSEQAAAERDQSHKTHLDEVKGTAEKNGVEIASLRSALDSVTKEIAQGREATDNCDKSIADLKSASSKCDIEISELKSHQERTVADVTELRDKLTETAAAASKPTEVDPIASANAAKLTELVDRTDAIDKTLTDIVLQSSRQRDTVQELSSKVAQLEKQRVASPVPPQAVEAPKPEPPKQEAPKQEAPQPEAPKEAPQAANSPQKAPADAADNYEDNYE